jgi:hypothetical protein
MARRAPVAPVIQEASLPAPMGGLNSISSGAATPGSDCVRLWNLLPSELGLLVRPGEREWCTGLTGAVDEQVRSTIAYSGSAADRTLDRVFSVTSTGIWDVTSSSASPTQVLAFASSSGDAGRGIHHAFVTQGGHFLLYCDEENGLHIYTEATDSWAAAVSDTTQAWATQTTYVIGDLVVNGSNVYVCDTDGVSAASGGPTGTGTNIVDGTARWDYVGPAVTQSIGPSLADQRLGLSADPADFVFAGVFKGRPWFVERDTARAWYLGAGSIYGTATSFNLATQFRSGGHLVGLWNWTYDGGAGMDDSLVAVSSGGDVAIYQGTDPASASTFGLKGVWSIGATPAGRRIATGAGGDVLLLSRSGLVPLSVLVVSGGIDRSQYATAKIGPLFNSLMVTRADLDGWGLYMNPEAGALYITIPTSEGAETEQLAMSLHTKGWARFRGLPIFSADQHQGKLYFGTADGRVCINDGYADGRTLADPNSYSGIEWAITTAFTNLGVPRKKLFKMVRTSFISDGGAPAFKIAARYDYDFNEAGTPDVVQASGDTWDSGLWDTAVWGGEYSTTQRVRGISGMGVACALALNGRSAVRTVLVGFDVFYVVAGIL